METSQSVLGTATAHSRTRDGSIPSAATRGASGEAMIGRVIPAPVRSLGANER